MPLTWKGRSLVNERGFSFITITDETPESDFLKVQASCAKRMQHIDECMRAAQLIWDDHKPRTKQPTVFVMMDIIRDAVCKDAGIVDS